MEVRAPHDVGVSCDTSGAAAVEESIRCDLCAFVRLEVSEHLLMQSLREAAEDELSLD